MKFRNTGPEKGESAIMRCRTELVHIYIEIESKTDQCAIKIKFLKFHFTP